jgi:hypothetical protein
MGAPGEAVVTYHTIGDEISGAGCDVEHLDFTPQRLDRYHPQLGGRLERDTRDHALSGDRWVNDLEQAKLTAQAAKESDVTDSGGIGRLYCAGKPKLSKTVYCSRNYFWVLVGDAQGIAAASLGVEDAGQKSPRPVEAGRVPPADLIANAVNVVACAGANRAHRSVTLISLEKLKFVSSNASFGEIAIRPVECLLVGQGETKAVYFIVRQPRPVVSVGAEVTISPHHAAEVTTPVVL